MELPNLESVSDWVKCFPAASHRAVDRLAASLFVNSHNPGGRLMAMFTAYFDASGDALKQPYVVVSGYIANYLQWKSYENMWTRIHDDHGVKKPFHMAEFVSALSNPKYAQQKNARPDYIAISQDPKKARSFLLELCITQATYVNCVVTCVVPMDVYNGVSLLLDLRTVIPPYALGARMCIERVHGWERMFSVVEPVECIFEEGDFEQGKFTELMVKEGWAKPIYKKKMIMPDCKVRISTLGKSIITRKKARL